MYIKINESEIADDYPEPAQYEKVNARTSFSHHSRTDPMYAALRIRRHKHFGRLEKI